MHVITRNAETALSAFDWTVVEVARRDGPRGIETGSVIVRVARLIFGGAPVSGLANKRLEALRCFCVRAWYSDVIRADELRALTDAGYSMIDIGRILAHVANYRGLRPMIQGNVT